MSSTQSRLRQNAPSHYMPLSSLDGLIFAYNASAGAGTVPFTNATWGSSGITQALGPYYSSVRGAGAGILKDLGKQVLSAGRVFRKVQLVVRQSGALPSTNASTFGVGGTSTGAAANQDYLTGYIELGYDGSGPATPVAQYGTL
jgi:hypothetical protein